jgi:mannose-6-phosphate isomerase-like protein (cupin superfamily)
VAGKDGVLGEKMREPIIAFGGGENPAARLAATGQSFAIREWRGSGPASLHVHHSDDEAWVVLEGTLRFRFLDRTVDVGVGSVVFVPAGVPHAYEALDARYLIILTPRLLDLIASLHGADRSRHAEIYQQYDSKLLE